MERNRLIRIQVLCNLLVAALDEPEAEGDFSSPQLVEQLRGIGERAAQRLEQIGASV
jgi:hypothetical protein